MLVVIGLMWWGETFLPSQMGKIALPGIGNLAIIGNLVLMSLLLYVLGPSTEQWTKMDLTAGYNIGVFVSWILFFYVYQHGKYDDGLMHPLSLAGIIFIIYGGMLYTTIGLFYVRTAAEANDIWKVGLLLALYVPISNHALLELVNSWNFFSWSDKYPRIFIEEPRALYTIIGGETLVVALTAAKLFFRNPWLG
ncbi:MAG: hypothetical protein Q7R59_00210 [bacterium]|nr:hypothetical protein [bacterium]